MKEKLINLTFFNLFFIVSNQILTQKHINLCFFKSFCSWKKKLKKICIPNAKCILIDYSNLYLYSHRLLHHARCSSRSTWPYIWARLQKRPGPRRYTGQPERPLPPLSDDRPDRASWTGPRCTPTSYRTDTAVAILLARLTPFPTGCRFCFGSINYVVDPMP